MKAVIMAAGRGVRMLPLTKTIPKVLVEVNGRPFLWYVIDNLHTAGITDICLIVSYKKVKVANHEKYGVLVVNDGKLVRIHEKPKEFVGDLINTGLYKFTS